MGSTRKKKSDSTDEEILSAALSCFGSVGFKATTLSRVAADAGVSRPTLYARHPDKTHLFRAVIQHVYDEAIDAAARTAASEGPFQEVLAQVLVDYYGGLHARLHDLPQIDELILIQSEQAEDVVAAARARMKKLLSALIRRYEREGSISTSELGVPLPQLVDLIRLAPLSLKTAGTTPARYRAGLRSFARVIAAAVRAH